MASGDCFDFVKAVDLARGLNAGPVNDSIIKLNGIISGVPLSKAGEVYFGTSRVWNNGTPLTTGITVVVELMADPDNADLGGTGVRIGLVAIPIASGTTTTADPGTTNEVLGTATMDTTGTKVTTLSIPMANAKLSSMAAGNHILLRIRRVPTDAADTYKGRVLLIGAALQDT